MNALQSSARWLGLALACSIITLAASVQAGKPVKPPKPPPERTVDIGVIYAQIEGDIYAISPDGSGDTVLTGAYTFVDLLGWCAEE